MNSHQKRLIRRKWYRDIQQNILDDSQGQGVFTTYHVLSTKPSWVDFRFLGHFNNSKRVWSVALQNIYGKYYEIVEDISFEEMHKKYPTPSDWNPFDNSIKNEDGTYTVKGSLSYYDGEDFEWHTENVKKLMNSGNISVVESIEIKTDYFPSVGCWAAIGKNNFDAESILKFINYFKNSGYKEFQGTEEFSFTYEEFEKSQYSLSTSVVI